MNEIEITTKISLDAELGATWFAHLDSDEQARFFVKVAEIAKTWENSPDMQWNFIGSSLRNCEDSKEDVRYMLSDIVYWMERNMNDIDTESKSLTLEDTNE